jgi:hypothetical protein
MLAGLATTPLNATMAGSRVDFRTSELGSVG